MLKVIPVTAAIIVRDNHALLARRSPYGHLPGLWEFPGGKIENGESASECLRRELAEELNIRIREHETTFFDVSFYEYGMRRVLLIGMTVGKFEGDPIAIEHSEIRWVKIQDLESFPLAPADVPLARRYMRYDSYGML